MLDVPRILQLHDISNAQWHDAAAPPVAASDAFEKLLLEHHRANFDIWHREDAARDPMAADQAIAAVKRAIDKLNQRRNDLAERVDTSLMESIPPQTDAAPLHSETPGLMIDRLSILALKIFHTEEEVHRPSANEAHHERNRERLQMLSDQRNDLATCLTELWSQVREGKRRFKVYHQLKMYNDPALNPVLYAQSTSAD